MKYLKLAATILKNLFLILIYEIKKIIIIPKRRKIAGVVILVGLVIGGGYKTWRYIHPRETDQNLSLWQAARVGQATTHFLMVQIENKNCPPEIASGCYERGDIVLIKPSDFQFSDGEKESFLILKMDITDAQADVLVRSLEQKSKVQPKEKTPDGRPTMDQLKIRRYAVDLAKIGISSNDTKGRVADTVYKWDIVKKK